MAQAATPTFSLAGTTLTISSATSGGTIYYVTDGTTPTVSSSSIVNGGTITVGKGETIRAFAVVSGFTNSAIASLATTSAFSALKEAELSTGLDVGSSDPARTASNKTPITGTNLGTKFIG